MKHYIKINKEKKFAAIFPSIKKNISNNATVEIISDNKIKIRHFKNKVDNLKIEILRKKDSPQFQIKQIKNIFFRLLEFCKNFLRKIFRRGK